MNATTSFVELVRDEMVLSWQQLSTKTDTATVVTAVLAFVTLAVWAYVSSHASSSSSGTPAASDTKENPPPRQTRRKRTVNKCPFTSETDFIVETAEHLPPHPCDLFEEEWSRRRRLAANNNNGKTSTEQQHQQQPKEEYPPLGVRWLNAGISGQDTPGVLRAGLKRLRDQKWFLVEEPFMLKEELVLKEKALDDPQRRDQVYVQEADSLDAQNEVLELFLHYLPRRYPDMYKYDVKAETITVVPFEKTFYIPDFASRPLELCERIVQEDVMLMRPPRPSDPFTAFAMAAAGVVFSFTGLPEKLGQPVEFIHAPVPGFEEHIRKTLELTFAKLLKVEHPLWRNNWTIAESGALDEILYGTEECTRELKEAPTRENLQKLFLKVEYQTIRRLPRSGYLLFTAKLMSDSLSSLEEYPNAAQCLAKSIRGMSKAMRAYKGISNDETCQAILEYLDSIGAS